MLTSFVIMVREGFEAALVVAILVAWVRRSGRPQLRRPLWQGVVAAALVSVVAGVTIHMCSTKRGHPWPKLGRQQGKFGFNA